MSRRVINTTPKKGQFPKFLSIFVFNAFFIPRSSRTTNKKNIRRIMKKNVKSALVSIDGKNTIQGNKRIKSQPSQDLKSLYTKFTNERIFFSSITISPKLFKMKIL